VPRFSENRTADWPWEIQSVTDRSLTLTTQLLTAAGEQTSPLLGLG
jgi:hypothetical protein